MTTSVTRVTALALVVAGLTVAGGGVSAAPTPSAVPATPLDQRPNIVLVLTDDLDSALVAQLRHVRRLAASGITFDNSFVVDSLCCPSRAATFTGMFPHNTGVRFNTSSSDDPAPEGGYAAFRPVEDKSFAVSMQDLGYRTGFMGKYMNQYPAKDGSPLPPGWDRWNAVNTGGYRGWKYSMTTSWTGRGDDAAVQAVRFGGLGDDQYVQTVLEDNAVDFIDDAEQQPEPYFLEVAPYATHSRISKPAHPGDPAFPPALRDRPSASDPDGNCGGRHRKASDDCSRLTVRDLPGFGQPTDDNRPYSSDGLVQYPGWLPSDRLPHDVVQSLDRDYRNRARMAQSIDRIVKNVVAAAEGEPTYIIFTSDNGYRLGQFRLGDGKGTAYTPDIDVPLVVGGSAVPPSQQGTTRSEVVMNVDLAPTFEDIAGLDPATDFRDGSSLLPLFEPGAHVPWRKLAYVEHFKPPNSIEDNPDQEGSTNRVPTYWAVRSSNALLIELSLPVVGVGGETVEQPAYEYYTDLSGLDAYEATNTYRPGDPKLERMRDALDAYRSCAGESCRSISVR